MSFSNINTCDINSLENTNSISTICTTSILKSIFESSDVFPYENNTFLEINSKNNFTLSICNYDAIFQKLIEQERLNFTICNKLLNSFLDVLYPKCDNDFFKISNLISQSFYKIQKDNINQIKEKAISYFFNHRNDFKYETKFLFNMESFDTLHKIGHILIYSYVDFINYDINSKEKLKNKVNEIFERKINIITDFYNFCFDSGKNPLNYSINEYINNINKSTNKYPLPAYLILLINLLSEIESFDIDLNLAVKNMQDELNIITITFLNLDIIYKKLKNVKLNYRNILIENNVDLLRIHKYKNELSNSNTFMKINEISQKPFVIEYIDLKNSISKNSYIIGNLLISMYALGNVINNIEKLELIIYESFIGEFNRFLQKHTPNKNLFNDSCFNVINLLNINSLKILNIEINSLDIITTKKIFILMLINKILTQISISFFSKTSPQKLYDIYNTITNNENHKKIFINDPESFYLDKILDGFEENMNIFFGIIKYKANLQKLNLDFKNIPEMLITQKKYILVLLKFIFNVFFILDDGNNIINEVNIIAPCVVLNSTICPDLENILEDIDIDENNDNLRKLSLELQIYKIINIDNLISTNLIELNIGDFDFFSLKNFVEFLTSFDFNIKSNLKNLSIGLLKNISDYNKKFTDILIKLFNIKIKNLIQINFMTNLHIKKKKYVNNVLSALKYNWISKCVISFNNQSESLLKTVEKNISYLVPYNLGNDLLEDLKEKEKYEKLISDNKNNEDYFWSLKGLIISKYKINDQMICKKIIYNILKYIHIEKKMDVDFKVV